MVTFQIKTVAGWWKMKFLLDTGADFTTLPDSLLPIIGVNPGSLPKVETIGVGGIIVPVRRFRLPLRVGNEELVIQANAVETRGKFSPALLGKKDLFESKFSLTIDSKARLTRIWKN